MRRFRFHLASLEKLLACREDQAKLNAAHAAADRERAAGLLGHLQDLCLAAHGDRAQRRADHALPVREEALYQGYFERMGHALEGQRQQVARATERCEGRQRELREAATRRRLMGLLRERRRAEYRRDALRELTRRLDEVGARQHSRAVPALPEEPPPAA